MYVALRSTTADAPQVDVRLFVAITVFYAGVLVAPWHAGVAGLGFLVALVGRRWRLPTVPSAPATGFLIVTSAVAVSALLPLTIAPLGAHGVRLLAQFVLLATIAGVCWTLPRSPESLAATWTGVTAGAVLAGVVAGVQVAVFDVPRAVGTEGNAIVFGDVAVLLGALSLALSEPALRWWSSVGPARARLVRPGTAVAAIGALVATLLSGSRGAWLAVAPVACLLLRQSRWSAAGPFPPVAIDSPRGRRLLVRSVIAATVVAAVVVAARGMPLERVAAGVDDVARYADLGEPTVTSSPAVDPAGTTVGARFEAWRSATDAAADHPLLGIGWGNLQSHFAQQVVSEGRHPRIAEFTHAHHQLLGAWASSGVVGLAAFVALMVVPAAHFRRAARSGDPDRRAVGTAGLVVVVAFAVFGLTESILENLVPVVFFGVTVGLLSSQLRNDGSSPVAERPGFEPGEA